MRSRGAKHKRSDTIRVSLPRGGTEGRDLHCVRRAPAIDTEKKGSCHPEPLFQHNPLPLFLFLSLPQKLRETKSFCLFTSIVSSILDTLYQFSRPQRTGVDGPDGGAT